MPEEGPTGWTDTLHKVVHSKIDLTICSRILSYNVAAQSLAERSVVRDSDYQNLLRIVSRGININSSKADLKMVGRWGGNGASYIPSACPSLYRNIFVESLIIQIEGLKLIFSVNTS